MHTRHSRWRLEPMGRCVCPQSAGAFVGLGQPRVPARSVTQLLTVSAQQAPEDARGGGRVSDTDRHVAETCESDLPDTHLLRLSGRPGGSLDSSSSPPASPPHSSQTNPNKRRGTPSVPPPITRSVETLPSGLASPWPPPAVFQPPHAVPSSLGSGPQGHFHPSQGARHSLPRGARLAVPPAWTAVPMSYNSARSTPSPPGGLCSMPPSREAPTAHASLPTAFLTPSLSTLASADPPSQRCAFPGLSLFCLPPLRHPGSVSAQGIWLLCWLRSPSASTCTRPTGSVRPAGPEVGASVTCATLNAQPTCLPNL